MALVRRPVRALVLAGVLAACVYLYLLTGSSYSRYGGIPYLRPSYDWSQFPQSHPIDPSEPIASLRRPTVSGVRPFPAVQWEGFNASAFRTDTPRNRELARRRAEVRGAFARCWRGYRARAWMRDELTPLTGTGKDPFGGWAATLVDALDSLHIMGFEVEFAEAVRAVAAHLDWGRAVMYLQGPDGLAKSQGAAGDADQGTRVTAVNVFETTIRHLGGLISAHDLSGEPALLARAVELGDMLMAAFDTPNRVPGFWLDFEAAFAGTQSAGAHDPSAAPTSLGLELTRLAQLTGDDRYYDAADRVARLLERLQPETRMPGMWPTFVNFRDGSARHHEFTLGALADSLYEYLPKMAALLGGAEPRYEKMYRGAADQIVKRLLFRPMLPDNVAKENGVLFVGNAIAMDDESELLPESQHLSCFVGGMFGLAGRLFGIDEHVRIGEQLAWGCGWAYGQFQTGIMPEIFNLLPCENVTSWEEKCAWDHERWFDARDGTNMDLLPKGFKNARDPRYLLRPEAVESLFILYRITGDEKYVEKAWEMFNAIQKATETQYGNAAIEDVMTTGETRKVDSMESFWLSETLKYFYLIFSPPDIISLDEFVLNTEAHPFRRPIPRGSQKGAKSGSAKLTKNPT